MVNNYRLTLEEEVVKAEEALAAAQTKLNEFRYLPEVQQLATLLHQKQCRYNHTDACSWEYENWNTEPAKHRTRLRYAEKAEKMLAEVDFATAEKVLNLL